MRIIAGIFGGRHLKAAVASATRPTSDRVREALASALDARGAFDDAQVLDLFAGTGALGFEAMSRGARHVVAVDSDRRALRCIGDNAKALGIADHVSALGFDLLKRQDVAIERLRELNREPFTLVFADPPYAQTALVPAFLEALALADLLAPQALVGLEHASALVPTIPTGFTLVSSYRYGGTATTILARLP